jgi:hypothetical protein
MTEQKTEQETGLQQTFNPSAFLADTEQKQTVVTAANTKPRKKRKRAEDDTDLDELKKKAESLCGSWEQAKIVRRYKKERLKDWIQQHEFDRDAAMRATVFDFIHKGYAAALDFISKADGHVESRVLSDLTLRQSIEDEGRDFVKYLNNKAKILFLTASNVYEGKRECLNRKTTEPHIEEIQDEEPNEYEPEPEGDYEAEKDHIGRSLAREDSSSVQGEGEKEAVVSMQDGEKSM